MPGGNYCGLNVTPEAAREMISNMVEARDKLTSDWDGTMTKERKRYLKDLDLRIELLTKIQQK